MALPRRVVALLLAVPLLWGMWLAYYALEADLRLRYVNEMLERWQAQDQVPPIGEWRSVRDSLGKVLNSSARSPYALELQGRLYEARARSHLAVLNQAYLHQALDAFQQSVALRPGAAATWANIALLKVRLGELDAAFEQAFRRAMVLGPREEGVQQILSRTALAALPDLQPSQKQQANRLLALTARYQARWLLVQARAQGRVAELCALQLDGKGIRDACRGR